MVTIEKVLTVVCVRKRFLRLKVAYAFSVESASGRPAILKTYMVIDQLPEGV